MPGVHGMGDVITCPACGTENSGSSQVCMNCGNDLSSTVAAGEPAHHTGPTGVVEGLRPGSEVGTIEGERRTIRMLSCDMKGSTAGAERLDPEAWTEIMNGAFERLIEPVYRYDRTVAQLMGDAILAFWVAPSAHEDDPQRAAFASV